MTYAEQTADVERDIANAERLKVLEPLVAELQAKVEELEAFKARHHNCLCDIGYRDVEDLYGD